jgi:hypothetical protein
VFDGKKKSLRKIKLLNKKSIRKNKGKYQDIRKNAKNKPKAGRNSERNVKSEISVRALKKGNLKSYPGLKTGLSYV